MGPSRGDNQALLAVQDDSEPYDETSKRSSFQDGKDSHEYERDSMELFETEDYAPQRRAHERPSVFARMHKLFRPYAAGRSQVSVNTAAESKFSRTARAIFNYPEAGMKLRSTAWLDGVRGLAAFEVFIYHYAREWIDRDPAWGPTKTANTDPAWYRFPFIRTFYNAGHASVAVFFVISGYVLSHKFLQLCAQRRHEQAYATLSSAVFRRAIRLFTPAAVWTFIVMIVCWICDPWLPKADPYVIEPTLLGEMRIWAAKVVAMLIPVNYPERWTALMNRYSGNVTWTISLEYYGSMVVFGVLLFTSRTQNFVVRQCLVGSMVALSFMKDDWPAGLFLGGLMFADNQLHRERQQKNGLVSHRSKAWQAAHKVFFYGLFVFGWFLSGLPLMHPGVDNVVESRPFFDIVAQPLAWVGIYDHRQGDQYLYALAGFCLLVGIGETEIKHLAEARFVQYLGKISFGFYLVHVPIRAWLGAFDPFWFGLFGSPYIPWDQRTESYQLFAIWMLRMGPAIVINLIAGGLFERFVDRPIIQLARKFETWCLSFNKQEEPIALPNYGNEHPVQQPMG